MYNDNKIKVLREVILTNDNHLELAKMILCGGYDTLILNVFEDGGTTISAFDIKGDEFVGDIKDQQAYPGYDMQTYEGLVINVQPSSNEECKLCLILNGSNFIFFDNNTLLVISTYEHSTIYYTFKQKGE